MIQTVRMFGAFPLSFSSVVFLYFSSEPLVARAAAGCRYKVPFTTELVFYAARYFYRFAKCRPGQKPKGVEPPYRRVYMCTVRCVSCACVCVCAFFPFCTPFEKPALAGQGKKTPLQTTTPFWATLLNNKARCSKHVRGSNALPSFPLSWLFAFFLATIRWTVHAKESREEVRWGERAKGRGIARSQLAFTGSCRCDRESGETESERETVADAAADG